MHAYINYTKRAGCCIKRLTITWLGEYSPCSSLCNTAKVSVSVPHTFVPVTWHICHLQNMLN